VSILRTVAALCAGVLFGFGLALGGMFDPSVIRGFLDAFGAFDPRLGFVFAGAVAVSAAGWAVSRRRAKPALAETYVLPVATGIDPPLIFGATLFGVGWGMVGFCPGPAIAALTLGIPSVFIFTLSMLIGMAGYEVWGGQRTGPKILDVTG
jgi:uncharacterized membrane protein YedE/YeeE